MTALAVSDSTSLERDEIQEPTCVQAPNPYSRNLDLIPARNRQLCLTILFERKSIIAKCSLRTLFNVNYVEYLIQVVVFKYIICTATDGIEFVDCFQDEYST